MRRAVSCATFFSTTVIAGLIVVLLASCAPAIPVNPRFVTNHHHRIHHRDDHPDSGSSIPSITVPHHELAWKNCTEQIVAATMTTIPGDIQLECADYEVKVDSLTSSSGTMNIGAVRAHSIHTPPQAGPIIFTTGSDLASSVQFPVWLSHAGKDLVQHHPVVAIDRRGMGLSTPINCRTRRQRTSMWNQAQFQRGDDPVANFIHVSAEATTACTDILPGAAEFYDTSHAAADLETLRTVWDVPSLAIIGVGNGAQIGLAYSGLYPDRVSRLILDSPISADVASEDAAQHQVRGADEALKEFFHQCLVLNCPLGADPQAKMNLLLERASHQSAESALSRSAIVHAVVVSLGYPDSDQPTIVVNLAQVLSSAIDGQTNGLINMINRARGIEGNDGYFANRCGDALERPTPDRIRQLVVDWSKQYSPLGAVLALELSQCLSWPHNDPPALPKTLPVGVLLMGVDHDPIVGAEGLSSMAAAIINAGSASKRVMWEGIGHGAIVYSSCTISPVIAYLNTGELPQSDVYCPAE